MKFIETKIRGLYVIELNVLRDDRGMFARTYCKKQFKPIGFDKEFVQMNFSFNNDKGTLRGMHFQEAPFEETKLIRCVSGKVFDVAVDLRKDSDTYLQWFGTELSHDNMKMILIPGGFAHGFLTLEDNSELIYHHTEYYNPDAERGLRYNDETINIQWPAEVKKISDKDKNYPLIKN
ncbi:MAG: dTDP-4-dehydrorhamnose 3,5-epimerase [Ignavibacteria bacterium]